MDAVAYRSDAVVPGGLDPNVWGRPTWDTCLLVAHLCASQGEDGARWADVFFSCLTRACQCEPCRRFEMHCWAMDDPSDRDPASLVDWVFDLRTIVGCKVHGPAALRASASRQALKRRIEATGCVGICPLSPCFAIMTMATRVVTAPLGEVDRSIRARSVFYLALAAARIMSASTTHYRLIGRTLLNRLIELDATRPALRAIGDGVFSAAYRAYEAHVKANGGRPDSHRDLKRRLDVRSTLPSHAYG